MNLSEARSYANLAAASSYYNLLPPGHADPVATARVLLEERALDSYANILFSLVAFWRAHAAWPQRLTLVSHEFKRARLVDAHCAAIGFPPDRVAFVGISPPDLRAVGSAAAADDDDLERAAAEPGRLAAAKAAKMRDVHAVVGAWMRDPHGVGETLAGKRRQRNCWGVDQMLFRDEEERSRSGLKTRVLDDGVEALIDDAPRPWAYASSGR